MDILRRTVIGSALLMGGLGTHATAGPTSVWGDPPSDAQADESAPLWPAAENFRIWLDKPPGIPTQLPPSSQTMNGPKGRRELWVSGISDPTISVFRAARPNGIGLLVFPGGGYSFLSVQNEGVDVARRYTALGITVFVLSYRLPGEGWHGRERVPLQDAQRAMRLLRSRSRDFGVDPGRIGILGFSAGGHLAADLATAFDEVCYKPADAADQISARPDFAGLLYPVASLEPGLGHAGTRDQLLGANADPGLISKHSPAEHVRADMPPCFVAHAFDDPVVPVDASVAMMMALRKAKVRQETHFFNEGGHGFGLHASTDLGVSQWPDLFNHWLIQLG